MIPVLDPTTCGPSVPPARAVHRVRLEHEEDEDEAPEVKRPREATDDEMPIPSADEAEEEPVDDDEVTAK